MALELHKPPGTPGYIRYTIPTNTLVHEQYDYISLSYTGDNLTTVVYKTGGSGGSTVATLTLAYTGAVLDTVTRS